MDAKMLERLVEETRKLAESADQQKALQHSLVQAMGQARESACQLKKVGEIDDESLAIVFTL